MMAQAPLAVLLSPRLEEVRAARVVGARTLVLAPDRAAPGIREAVAAAHDALTVDWLDHQGLLMAIGHLAAHPARVSVFGFAEASALVAARVNEALRFRGNPHAAVAYLTDKVALRGKVNQLTGTPVRFEQCDRVTHLVAAAERVGFPCVAKPRTGSGGQEVHLLRDVADAALLAAELVSEPALIIEEFLEGPEYSVLAHSRDGEHTVLAVARKHLLDGPGFTEEGHDLPADLGPGDAAAIGDLVTATLGAAGHRAGLSLTEVVRTAQGPRLIESHAHPGPGRLGDLLALATGTDPVALAVATALRLPVPAPHHSSGRRYAGIRTLRLPPGRLDAVHGIDEAYALPGVADIGITVRVGSHVPEATSRAAGHGFITAVASCPQEVEAVLGKALGLLRPVVGGADPGACGRPARPEKEEEHTAA